MRLIQFLILVIILLSFNLTKLKNRTLKSLYAKLILTSSFSFFIFFLFNPNILQDIALKVGVGRGTDLLVYLIATGVFLAAFAIYVKIRELESKISILVRNLAIIEKNQNSSKK